MQSTLAPDGPFWDTKIASMPAAQLRFLRRGATESHETLAAEIVGGGFLPPAILDPFATGKAAEPEPTIIDHMEKIRNAAGDVAGAVRGIAGILRRRVADYFAARVEASRAHVWASAMAAGVAGGTVNFALGFL